MNIQAAIDEYLASKQNSITHKTYQFYDMFLTYFDRFCQTNNLTDLTQITVPLVQAFPRDAQRDGITDPETLAKP